MTYLQRLLDELRDLESVFDTMMDNSSVYYSDLNERSSDFVFIGFPNYYWSKRDEKTQIKTKGLYDKFYAHFELLLAKAPKDQKRKLDETNRLIIKMLEQKEAPSSTEGGKITFRRHTGNFKKFLSLLDEGQNRIVIIPDTNALIQVPDPSLYKSFVKSVSYDFVILPTVLSELDKLKINHRNEALRQKVNSVVRRLKGYRKQGDVHKGVVVNKTVKVRMVASEPRFDTTLNWLDPTNNDDRIIASALNFQIDHPYHRVVLVSSDINFQNKAELAHLAVFDTDDIEE